LRHVPLTVPKTMLANVIARAVSVCDLIQVGRQRQGGPPALVHAEGRGRFAIARRVRRARANPGTMAPRGRGGESGTITNRDSSVPLSYLDDKLQPIGFSLDLCRHVVEAIKAKLAMPNLKVV
jgi:ABC-type amino acid transport substrate-binding protein